VDLGDGKVDDGGGWHGWIIRNNGTVGKMAQSDNGTVVCV
jgi:hypothetical protein